MGGNVVYRLTQSLPSGVNYKIFFDNYFSSIDILRLLKEKNFLAVATIRKDRLKDASKKLLNEKDLKKAGRGSSDYIVDVNSGICIVRWYDNNIVQLISNYVGNEPGTPANRWSKKDKKFVTIDRPKIVEIYNAHMGGVIYVICC
ncbi:piggyBac transposable element-derived protein 2-like [Hydra vulgaris]|uniref:piggyBac transposable element-derived protein 2-like n=1 Tax=Hydra vulgaris TaxID=6087 RepID=UPI0032E9E0DD